jgi:hypothetical protein
MPITNIHVSNNIIARMKTMVEINTILHKEHGNVKDMKNHKNKG